MKLLRRLIREMAKASLFSLIAEGVCVLVNALVPAAATLAAAAMFDAALKVWEGAPLKVLLTQALVYLGVYLLSDLFGAVEAIVRNGGLFERSGAHFKALLYEKTASLPLIAYESSDTLNRLERAQSAIASGMMPRLFKLLLSALSAVVTVGGVTAVLLAYSPWIAPLVLLSVAPYLFARLLRGREFYKLKTAQTKDSRTLQYLWKLFTSPRSVKEMRVLGFGGYIAEKWRGLRDKTQEALWVLEKKEAASMLLCDALRIIGYALTILAVLLLGVRGIVSLGVFGASIAAVLSLQNAARDFLVLCARIPEHLPYVKDYFAFLDMREETPGAQKPVPPDGGISARGVSFTYPGADSPALKDIDLTVQNGEKVVIVGVNGSGKTTLAKVLLGVYPPDSGAVLFGGVPLGEMDPEAFYKQVSVVAQDFTRYMTTVRENIGISDIPRMGQDSAVHAALEKTGLNLPDLDAAVGREFDGLALSGGQWQKLAISRGLFKDSRLIVLDEPTASLDPFAENEILTSFIRAAEGKTALIISHRTGLCRLCDRIIVMKDGRIVQMGSHAELYAQDGEYARLFGAQAKWYEA